jgi:hypothetical protein
MAPGVLSRRSRGALEVADDNWHRTLQLEHEAGIDDVLAGRPPVHVPSGVAIWTVSIETFGRRPNQRF